MGVDRVRRAPYRIETERLVIRCYEPGDAPLLVEAVTASLEHLRPWMPWTRYEPQTVAQRESWIVDCRTQFEACENFTYGIFDRGETRLLGGTGLHRRLAPDALEIGYWIRSDALRRGLATEVTAVLTRVALERCDALRVDVQVDPRNVPSAGVPRKLGFRHEGTLREALEPDVDGGPRRDSMLFSVLREELDGSPCLEYAYTA